MQNRKCGRKYCKHCDNWLAKSTYYSHRSQFYDKQLKVWRKDIKASETYTYTSSESDVEMEDGELQYYECIGDNESGGGEQLNGDDCDKSPLESQGHLPNSNVVHMYTNVFNPCTNPWQFSLWH